MFIALEYYEKGRPDSFTAETLEDLISLMKEELSDDDISAYNFFEFDESQRFDIEFKIVRKQVPVKKVK